MDFLDPKLKQKHKIRLFIGYALMAVLIFGTSAVLVFSAYGFDVDRKTGEVIQNSLVFVDSAPDGSTVSFNGNDQKDKTNSRFALPAGSYDLKLRKDSYRDWQRSFDLAGGEVERFTYPMMILKDLKPQELKTYEGAPSVVTESPDRRWAIVSKPNSVTDFIEYDLNSVTNNQKTPVSRDFSIPTGVLAPSEGPQSIELVEWSNDNKHFLLKHTFNGASFEFIVVSRDQPDTTININKLLTASPTTVTLRDKKFDQWYLYSQDGGVLQAVDARRAITPLLTGVTSYKSHDDDTILYSSLTSDGQQQRITLLDGTESTVIDEVKNGPVFLDIARYDNEWYTVIGAGAEQKTYVYKDPVGTLKKKENNALVPVAVLRSPAAPLDGVSFSNNTRFIMARSGQHFEVYDAEYEDNYAYDISDQIDASTKVTWIDGHRLTVRSQNKVFIFDFDGSNKQELVSALPGTPMLFDRDYTVVYTANNSTATAGKFGLFGTELRLEEDK